MPDKDRRHWSARLLARVFATPTLLFILGFLPVIFPEGTPGHETAFSLRTYGVLGVLLSEFFAWWARTVIELFESRKRDWSSDPWFLVAILALVPVMSLFVYFPMRVFEHAGDWNLIFGQFSLGTLGSAFLICNFGAFLSTLTVMTFARLDRGENPLIEGAKAPPRWIVLLILLGLVLVPMLCLLLYRAVHG